MAGFRRQGKEGHVRVDLDAREVELLAGLPAQLKELIELGEGRVHERLFPAAYLDPTEDAAEREWQRLTHEELVRTKIAAAEIFSSTLARVEGARVEGAGVEGARVEGGRRRAVLVLEPEEAAAWLGTLNDIRLVLGVMLDVTEDLDWSAVDADDPRAPALHLYGFLTWVQDELIAVMGG